MTAGLPGTHCGGSRFDRRILAALLIMMIAAAPARAQGTASADGDIAAAHGVEDAAVTDASNVRSEARDSTEAPEPTNASDATEAPQAMDAAGASEAAQAPEATAASEAPENAFPAESNPSAAAGEPAADKAAQSIDQAIYKGVVGNILEALPMNPEQRVQLQRGNAIINNTFAGRSVALLLGIASPPLMIAGLMWGIWSAINIKNAPADMKTALAPSQPAVETMTPAGAAKALAVRLNEPVPGVTEVAAQSLD